MFAALASTFMEMCAKFFSWRTASVENQSTTEVIRDKRKTAKKFANQEDLLFDMAVLLQKYLPVFEKRDRVRARVYISKVKRLIKWKI